jgi:hypothetical protein
MSNAPPSSPADHPDLERGGPTPADPLHSLGEATQRVSASSLNQNGVKTVRVLNETRFLSVLEHMVEERIRARVTSGLTIAEVEAACGKGAGDLGNAGARDGQEEFRARWELFRSRYEEKLRKLEEALAAALAAAPSLPAR